LLITLALGTAFSLFVAAIAVPVDLIFNKDVGWLLIATAALAFFQPFQLLTEQVCQGLNRIKLLSAFQIMIAGLYLATLVAFAAAGRLDAGTALGAYLGAIGAATIFAMARLGPRLRDSAAFARLAIKEARRFGLNIYLARILAVASSRADQLLIAYFIISPVPLGVYSIVQKFSNPIIMLGRSLAVTRYRAFAKLESVPRRIIRWNALITLTAAAGLVIVGPTAIRLLLPQYSEGTGMLLPFALTSLFAGLFQPFNIFLQSHGRGAELRNIVLFTGLASLAGLVAAVPRWGILGAAWVGAGAMALDYLLHLHYYSRFRRTMNRG
jgi:O-antigen/teichoic acid export membrane protein